MKRFSFSLRSVAVLRGHREQLARDVFAASVHAYVQAEEHLALVRAQIADLGRVLAAGRSGTFLAADAAALFRVYRSVSAAEMTSERDVIEKRDVMKRRRAEYLEANRQLKIVRQLEDKARARHRAETLRHEQAELDDFAGFRAARPSLLPS
ncbi:MAG: flagellar export protein FliJ [Lacunisphaera sp.]|nr:flagellar export protein FliJ [Lacunisphaera sp.]